MGSIQRLVVVFVLGLELGLSHIADASTLPPLNVGIIMDKSLSIGLDNKHCQSTSNMDCWPLAVDLAQQIVKVFESQLPYGSTTENSGLCVSMMTVSCDRGKAVTKFLTFDGCSDDRDEVDGALYRLGQLMVPHGGTCPSEAFDTTARIFSNMRDVRPVSLVIYMTDTDVDETDSTRAKEAWARLKATPGITTKTYLIGRKWSAGETQKVIDELKQFDAQAEVEKIRPGRNSGRSGSIGFNAAGGMSTGAIAGIAVGCVAGVAAIYLVAKRRSEGIYDLV